MELFLIDAIGPFFRNYSLTRINWSKIPFDHLALDGEEREEQWAQIRTDMRSFANRVASVGYNAVSLDDMIHLADHEFYEPEIRSRIQAFRAEFQILFEILAEEGLQIFLTQDVLSYTPAIREKVGLEPEAATAFLKVLIESFFQDFPLVSGLILRVGESDGLDVRGDFRSELVLRTASQVRQLLSGLLPVFEQNGRKLIFRTWTVGAYSIGDLMWHRRTLARAVKGINSPALILSMKYGESDFFRFLPLNRNFFGTDLPKIVELQTRREYEGCGEFPSFTGSDYERYATELTEAKNVVGISVWCQTGGWLPFRRLAYLDDGAVWTEINSFVTLRIFKHGDLVEHAVSQCAAEIGSQDPRAMLELLRLSDEVVKELLYFPDYAQLSFFFMRVRLPPMLGVYWNTIFVNHSIRKVFRHFARDHGQAIREGHNALRQIERMRDLATRAGLPREDIDYMLETFKILSLAREYFFQPESKKLRKQLKAAKKRYKSLYPRGTRFRYRISLDFEHFHGSTRFLLWLFQLVSRKRPGYRVVDQVLMLHLLRFGYRFINYRRPHWIPEFARKSAMGIDALFR